MRHCPSQDWDRYAADQEAGELHRWIAGVSKKIKSVYPAWDLEAEQTDAADETGILWGSGLNVIVPYTDGENDDYALVIRTMSLKGVRFRVFPLPNGWYIWQQVSAFPGWDCVGSVALEPRRFTSEVEALRYLTFCCSSEPQFETELDEEDTF